MLILVKIAILDLITDKSNGNYNPSINIEETKPTKEKKIKKTNVVVDYLHQQQIAANSKSDLQVKLRKLFNF